MENVRFGRFFYILIFDFGAQLYLLPSVSLCLYISGNFPDSCIANKDNCDLIMHSYGYCRLSTICRLQDRRGLLASPCVFSQQGTLKDSPVTRGTKEYEKLKPFCFVQGINMFNKVKTH